MKNVTLAIDEDVLREARVYAAKHNTTVNALVREYLSGLVAQEERAAEARRRLVKMSEESKGRLGPDWKWNREEIYEDRLFPRHERAPLRGFGEGDGGGEEGNSS
jgi:plasmid stability protein